MAHVARIQGIGRMLACCEHMAHAFDFWTDSEEYESLARMTVRADGSTIVEFGFNLPPIAYCPWCGSQLPHCWQRAPAPWQSAPARVELEHGGDE